MEIKVNQVYRTLSGRLALIVNDPCDNRLMMLWYDKIARTFNVSETLNRLDTLSKVSPENFIAQAIKEAV